MIDIDKIERRAQAATAESLRALAKDLEKADLYGDHESFVHGRCSDALNQAADEIDLLKAEVRRLREEVAVLRPIAEAVDVAINQWTAGMLVQWTGLIEAFEAYRDATCEDTK